MVYPKTVVLGLACLDQHLSHPEFTRGPISSNSKFTRPPFEEKLKILASSTPILAKIFALNPPNLEIFSSLDPSLEIFSSQDPKFKNFQFTRLQNLEIFSSQDPFSEAMIRSQAPHSESRAAHHYLKKLSAPSPGVWIEKINTLSIDTKSS